MNKEASSRQEGFVNEISRACVEQLLGPCICALVKYRPVMYKRPRLLQMDGGGCGCRPADRKSSRRFMSKAHTCKEMKVRAVLSDLKVLLRQLMTVGHAELRVSLEEPHGGGLEIVDDM